MTNSANRPSAVGLSSAQSAASAQDIETLKKRYDHLSKEKTRAETNLDNARRQLEELKKQARDNYGTDDLTELKSKLQAMKDENERKRSEYQRHLEKIETDLQQIEREYEKAGGAEGA
jgi:chromosome segregation ATPase